MFFSMVVLSFLVLITAWKSFERNLGTRLGGVSIGEETQTPGPLRSLIEDVKKIAGGEEPLIQETSDTRQETVGGWIEQIFSFAREIRRVVKYNAGEIGIWVREASVGFWERLR